jgi:hypothetical protein
VGFPLVLDAWEKQMRKLWRYFDLNTRGGGRRDERNLLPDTGPGGPTRPQLSVARQLALYFALLVGVLFSSVIDKYKAGATVAISISPAVLLVSAVIALMLIPIVYGKLNVQPDAPFFVQIGLFVQGGVFWHAIVSTAAKAFT